MTASPVNVAALNFQRTLPALWFWGLLAFLLWVTLPKAGMTPFAQGAINLFVQCIFLACCFQECWVKQRTASELQLRAWLAPWVVVTLLILLQLTIIPRLLGWGWIFGDEVPGWDIGPRAVNAQEMLHYWALFTSYWAIAWMVSLLDIGRYRQLMYCVMVVVVFQCLYGLFAFVGGQETIIGLWPKIYYLNDVTGTFVNRNHLAGFIAICWPLCMNFIFLPHAEGGPSWSAAVRGGVGVMLSLLLFVALIATHSRMGLTAGLVGMGVWLYLVRSRVIRLSDKAWRWLLVALGVLLVLAGLWYGIEDVIQRFMMIDESTGRWIAWRAAFELPAAAWIWGIGAGAFPDVFTLVHPLGMPKTFFELHNDFLQFVLEFGIVGTVAVVASLVYWGRKAWPDGIVRGQSPNSGALTPARMGAVGSVAAIALHSTVDFNLQIPGSAAFFWIAVGVLMNPRLVVVEVPRRRRKRRRRRA